MCVFSTVIPLQPELTRSHIESIASILHAAFRHTVQLSVAIEVSCPAHTGRNLGAVIRPQARDPITMRVLDPSAAFQYGMSGQTQKTSLWLAAVGSYLAGTGAGPIGAGLSRKPETSCGRDSPLIRYLVVLAPTSSIASPDGNG